VLPAADLSTVDNTGLVRAILDGDPRAPRILWDRYRGVWSTAFCAVHVGQQNEVEEDLVQEVFLNLFRRLPTLRDPRTLPAFLVTMTTLTLRHELTSAAGCDAACSYGAKEDIDPDLRAVHPNPEARQAVARLYAILDRIGREERMAFVLAVSLKAWS